MFDKYEKHGAYHWAWYDDPNYAWYKECVDRCVGFCQGSTIDLGGGEGLVAKKIQDNKFMVMVVDNDPTAGKLCWENGVPCQAVNINRTIIAAPHVRFEYMVCLNTIEHLNSPKNILKLLKENITKGAIIITDKPTGHVGRYHEHEYTKEELLDLFKDFKPKYFEINSTEHGKPITFHGVEIRK